MIGKVTPAERRAESNRQQPTRGELPKISKLWLRFFAKHSERFVQRNFHSVRLLKRAFPATPAGMPVVVYLNHASWWDPLVCLLLARRFFRERDSYAPIAANSLERYRLFRNLGFFGVRNGTLRGAAQFLESARAILAANETALWLTPQGKFVDPRARPLRFERGLGHLATCVERAAFVPLALEYVFWEERRPEILIGFGPPIIFDSHSRLRVSETTQLFESALSSLQDQIASASQRRRPDEWTAVLRGRTGSHRVYDLWRRARARFRRKEFTASHSGL